MRGETDFSKGQRGVVVQAPAGKTRVTIRLDDDTLEWFRDELDKACAGNYQTPINRAPPRRRAAFRVSGVRGRTSLIRVESSILDDLGFD